MAKKSKQEKKGEELDIVLEQLISQIESEGDEDDETDEKIEDPELLAILKQVFAESPRERSSEPARSELDTGEFETEGDSVADADEDEESIEITAVTEESEDDENSAEIDAIEDEVDSAEIDAIEENSSEAEELDFIESPADDLENEESDPLVVAQEQSVDELAPSVEEVEGVFDIMFANRTAKDKSKDNLTVTEPEERLANDEKDETESFEDFDEEDDFDPEDDLTVAEPEERLASVEEAETESFEDFDEEDGFDPEDDLTVAELEERLASVEEDEAESLPIYTEEKNERVVIKILQPGKEEHHQECLYLLDTTTEPELSSPEQNTVDAEEDSVVISIAEEKQAEEEAAEPMPIKILDPADYTLDPMQTSFPRFQTVGKARTIDQEVHIKAPEEDVISLDSNDVSLLLKFGYDEEVKSKIGEEETRKALFEKDSHFSPEPHQIPFGFNGSELTDRSQIARIKKKYRADKRTLIIQTVVVGIIALMILAVNVFFEFFSDRTSFPVILGFEFFLMALIGLVIYRKLYGGMIGLLRLEASRYSLPVLILAFYTLYDMTAMILYIVGGSSVNTSRLMLFGFTVATYVILTMIADLISCMKEYAAFAVIASSDTLYVAEKQARSNGEDRSGEEEGFESGEAHEKHRTHYENTYRIRKASLISGYFKKTAHDRTGSVNLIYLLGVTPVCALIMGCICAILGNSLIRGVSAMMLTFFLCVPFSYTFLATFSEYITAAKLKKKHHAALIDYDAIQEYARCEALIFKDTEAVEMVSYTEIHPAKNENEKEHLVIAYQVLKALGGPLGQIANGAVEAEPHSISINSISANGINLYYDSSVNILIGDKNYMNAYKIKVKTDSDLSSAVKGSGRSVLYMAFDGAPKLGFIVNSKVRADFADTLIGLSELNIRALVESYEPQINTSYFEQNLKQAAGVAAVCKPSSFESSRGFEVGDGGIVCSSNAQDAARAITLCRSIIDRRKQTRHTHLALVLCGALAAVLLAIFMCITPELALFTWIQAHISFLANLLMFIGLIPGVISLYKLKKQDSGDNKTK